MYNLLLRCQTPQAYKQEPRLNKLIFNHNVTGLLLKLKISILILALIALLLIKLKTTVSAAIILSEHNRNFEVSEDFVKVTESKTTSIISPLFQVPAGAEESFTIFHPAKEDPSYETKKKKTIESIVLTDKSGNPVAFKVEPTDNSNEILKIIIPQTITSQTSETFNLQYNSYGLMQTAGAVKDVYIPGFPEGYLEDSSTTQKIVKTVLNIPKSLGSINFTQPKNTYEELDTFYKFDISQESFSGKSTWVQIGTKQYFKFKIEKNLPSTSSFFAAINSSVLPVPRDTQTGGITQKVYFTNISPAPFKVFTDKDNNLMFEYRYSASANQKILIEGYAVLESDLTFDIKNSGDIDIIPSQMSDYLQPAIYWESDNLELLKQAELLKANKTNIFEIVQSTYDFVIKKIDYSFVKKFGLNERQGALATLKGSAAVCMEYSDLFIALLRAQGIPARAAFGFGYGSLDFIVNETNDINHQWAEVYYPAQNRWVSIDTTWGDFGNEILGGDLNHFLTHVASLDPNTPSTSQLSYVGELQGQIDRRMDISIIGSLEGLSTGQTQEQVLSNYQDPKGVQLVIKTLGIYLTAVVTGVNTLLINFGVESQITRNIILMLPLLIVIALVIVSRARRLHIKK